jgi:hypothetical protein
VVRTSDHPIGQVAHTPSQIATHEEKSSWVLMNKLEQQKAWLQDFHDPRDLGQKQNNRTGDLKPPKQQIGPYHRGKDKATILPVATSPAAPTATVGCKSSGAPRIQ